MTNKLSHRFAAGVTLCVALLAKRSTKAAPASSGYALTKRFLFHGEEGLGLCRIDKSRAARLRIHGSHSWCLMQTPTRLWRYSGHCGGPRHCDRR